MIFLFVLMIVASQVVTSDLIFPTYEGDTPHISTYSKELEHTAHILQRQIANVIRKDFNFLRESVTVFADTK